jgi:hypothetical protein
LLSTVVDAHSIPRRKETVVLQKKMFKVLSKSQGGYWMRVGTGFENRDQSVNIILDSMPRTWELQLREYDAEDIRKREERAANGAGAGNGGGNFTRIPPNLEAREARPDGVPF